MTPSRVHALPARIAVARSADEAERGSILIYVLIVTMLVTTAVTALVMTTTQAITPTQDSVNRTAAYAAAQAGLQDAIAYVNTQCPKYGVRCDTALGAGQGNVKAGGTDVLQGSNQSFAWKIASSYVTDSAYNRYLRVTSIGSSRGRAVALVADVQAVPNPLDYEYYSTYETNGTADISALTPGRSVSIDCSTVSTIASSLTFSCGSGTQTASWGGSAASTLAGATNPVSPSPSVCDRLWYYSTAFNGADGSGRAQVQTGQTLRPGTDWVETGTAGGKSQTRYVPCQVAFTNGQVFNGKAYTVDAPLVSNGTPGNTTSATFAGGLTTAWQATSVPAPDQSTFYRPDVVGGSLPKPAVSQSNPLTFSNTFNPTPAATSCIFFGPTRVKLNGDGTATVTSPQTTPLLQTGQAGCYATKNSYGQFVVNYKQYGNGVIYVKNNGTGFRATGQKSTSTASSANTAFWLTNSTVSGTLDQASVGAGDTCSTSSSYTGANANPACAWSGTAAAANSGWAADTGSGWTSYTSNSSNVNNCATLSTSDRLRFECEFNGGSVAAGHTDYYALFRQQRIQIPLTRNTISGCAGASVAPATASAADLACFLNSALQPANSGAATSGSSARQYVVSNTSAATTTTSQAIAGSAPPTSPIGGDSFFTQQAGSGAVETVTSKATTFTIGRQTGTCNALVLLGSCLGTNVWGDGTTVGASVPQFQVTITQKSYSNLQAGSPAVSYFPSMTDVTQYATGATGATATSGAVGTSGPGDVYIEGTNTAPLSVLADDDAVVTGNLLTSGAGATLLDTLGDIRVYNPVSCKDQTAASINVTTAGFCPNDITGLYTGGLVSGAQLNAAHPAKQYLNMLSSPVNAISAALVAQGSSNATGSIRTDNADRAANLGTLSVTGGMYQRHRGSLGVQWEYPSTATTARVGSGYKVSMGYNDLQNVGLTYLPAFQGGSPTRYWNVVSASSCVRLSAGQCVGSGT